MGPAGLGGVVQPHRRKRRKNGWMDGWKRGRVGCIFFVLEHRHRIEDENGLKDAKDAKDAKDGKDGRFLRCRE
jgi:hypothetical protein